MLRQTCESFHLDTETPSVCTALAPTATALTAADEVIEKMFGILGGEIKLAKKQ